MFEVFSGETYKYRNILGIQIPTHFNSHAHSLDSHLAFLLQRKTFTTKPEGNRVIYSINCPVDFEFSVSFGNLAGRITNNIIDEELESVIYMWVDGDAKNFVLPLYNDYTIVKTGTADGIMNMTISSMDPETWDVVESTEFKNISLQAGKRIISTVDGDEDTEVSDIKLFITDDSGNITGEILKDGTEVAPPITAPSTGVPAKITAFSASAGNKRVTLRWTAPDNGGSPITSYQFRQRTGSKWGAWIDVGLNTSRTVTGLKNGTSYRFEVIAINAIGESEFSDTLTIASGAPASVTNLKATAGNGRVTLKWKAPNNNGSSITRYQYRQRTGTGKWGSWKVLSGSGVSRNVTKLSNGRSYDFQIRAVNKNGSAFESNIVNVTPRKPPAAIKKMKATAGDRQVTLSWTAPNNGGSAITRYQYRQRTGNGKWGKWKNLSGLETTQIITGLKNGTTYRFEVRAVNAAGNAPSSNAATATLRR